MNNKPSARGTVRVGLNAAVVALLLLCGTRAGGADEPPPATTAAGPVVTVERTDGTALTGRLVRIDARAVTIEADGSSQAVELGSVRRVDRGDPPPAPHRPLLLTWVDGATLEGDDFAWDGKAALLVRPEGRVELPMERVRSLAWRTAATPGAEPEPAAWMASIPESAGSDLLAVARTGEGAAEAFEFVECAIKGVSAEAVTVVLDDETIPVRRSKVLGLHLLVGDAAEPVGIVVDVAGGSVRGARVEWSPEGLVVDGAVRLPADMVRAIDYAAGRSVPLASLPTERVEVDPWFGPLAKVEGLGEFFAPRTLPATAAWPRPGMVVRPRTVAVWRLPADGRRFRAVVSPAAGRQAAGGAVVTVAVDDREVFRRQVDVTAAVENEAVERPVDSPGVVRTGDELPGIPIDVDVSGGRRLTVTVDFCAAGATSAAVRFSDPTVEK